MSDSPKQLHRSDLLVITITYLLGTLIYHLLGVRFDASPFPRFMQFIDKDLLTDRLVESIWHYHAFPPLLNVFVGVGEKLFGGKAVVFFSVSFHFAGLLLVLAVGAITARLSGSRAVAVATASVLTLMPSFVLYQNWLMYTFPAAALLGAGTYALQRFLDSGRTTWGFVFFGALAALTLTRSIFHLGWLVLVGVVLASLLWNRRRQVALVAALPILLVACWYGKNYYLFGTFSSSSVAGLGLANITTLTVPGEELLPLVRNGTLSPFALVSRYAQKDLLFSSQKLEPTGIPVLDRLRKKTGDFNYNNLQIVAVNQYYLRDGLTTIRHFPYHYVTGLRISNLLFFSPTHMNAYFAKDNRDAVWPMEWFLNPLLYGVPAGFGYIMQPHWNYDDRRVLEANPSVPLMILWVIVLSVGYVNARRGYQSNNAPDKAHGILVAFIVCNAIYVYCMGTMLELGENYRYRFLIEPLFLVLTAFVLSHLFRAAVAGTRSLRKLRRYSS